MRDCVFFFCLLFFCDRESRKRRAALKKKIMKKNSSNLTQQQHISIFHGGNGRSIESIAEAIIAEEEEGALRWEPRRRPATTP